MDISTTTAPDITLRSPADLLSAVPYLIGYVPRDRLVLIGLSGSEIVVTACAPLPSVDEPASQVGIPAEAIRTNRIDEAVVVGYGSAQRVTRCVDHVTVLLRDARVDLIDALRVTDDRYWSYVCNRPSCCPPEGSPLDHHSAVAAEFTLGGAQALPDREAAVARFSLADGSSRAAVTREINRFRDTLSDPKALLPPREVLRSEGSAILNMIRQSARLPDHGQIARLAVALTDARVRTEALLMVDEEPPGETVDLWLWVTRHVTGAERATPAALLAYAAWRQGNGLLAGEAVDRCLAAEPGHELAHLMAKVLRSGVPPTSLPALDREQMTFGDTEYVTAG